MHRRIYPLLRHFLTLAIAFAWTVAANAQGLSFLTAPGFTESNVISDSAGNLYGTVQNGPDFKYCNGIGCGFVYEASPASGGGWTAKVLYSFTGGSDGASPAAGLVFDSSGNLYGTTQNGGGSINCSGGCGTVFKLSPNSDGTWSEIVLHTFHGVNDGMYPVAGLIVDASGNLYGTASDGGANVSGGVVFKLYNTASGWKERVLHSFSGSDGQFPSSALLRDSAGNLYGSTTQGGAHNAGVVYVLSPASRSWTFSDVYDFTGGADGNGPVGDLTMDASGRIYGATLAGGLKSGGPGNGVVYRLTNAKGWWRESVLHSFTGGTDASNPTAGVTFDLHGNLYGTTQGSYTTCTTMSCGQAFQLTRSNGTWSLGNVYPIPNGFVSLGGITRDAKGNLFFTASDFHYQNSGDLYQLNP